MQRVQLLVNVGFDSDTDSDTDPDGSGLRVVQGAGCMDARRIVGRLPSAGCIEEVVPREEWPIANA